MIDTWQALQENLQNEAISIRESSGEVVEVKPDSESNLYLSLIWKTKHMRLMYIPRNNFVKWETTERYGFEPLPEFTPSLAVDLMQRLFRR